MGGVNMTLNAVEREALEILREGLEPTPLARSDDPARAWALFGLHIGLRASAVVRLGEVGLAESDVETKADGSPATRLDHDIETMVREALQDFAPGTALVGEETGGELPPRGTCLAIDPVDGTWAYIGGTSSYSVTIALVEDGVGTLGVVAAPAAGRITYATEGCARVLQLSAFGEPDAAHDLPVSDTLDPILVNLHPGRTARATADALYAAWDANTLRMVRSPGGSPSLALAEAAAGRFVYVNLWTSRPAEPFDLVAGALIVRAAGGDVVDLAGRPVEAMTHAGPFVAAIDPRARATVTELVATGRRRS
jgi:fructose-1,6-bisphosphatase/inositol monophosphatase family enzyme